MAVWGLGSGLVAWRFGGSCMGALLLSGSRGRLGWALGPIDRGRDELVLDHAGFKLSYDAKIVLVVRLLCIYIY